MTPILVLFFGIDPLAAISSDLVASFFMKPIGGGVHFRRGTVNLHLVRWLVVGSIPAAFTGVLLLDLLGATEVQDRLKTMLGAVLLVAATAMVVRGLLSRGKSTIPGALTIRPLPTVCIGVVGGLIVGMTSVGSGSLMIVMLMLLYPTISGAELVGTDLVQAIPLVGAASLGHIFFGDLQMGLTGSLLVGCLPGVYLGARVSSRAPDHVIRPVLIVVLTASALKLLGVSNAVVGILVGLSAAAGLIVALRHAARSRSSIATEPITSPTDVASATSIPETT
ncbi:MAG: sulfite exporter TauE/SafE family protein [Acidimicrobiia bacterium]|nr:sulfite exporter TauE/SafE family protein [Acidimicrobiia bacterium]